MAQAPYRILGLTQRTKIGLIVCMTGLWPVLYVGFFHIMAVYYIEYQRMILPSFFEAALFLFMWFGGYVLVLTGGFIILFGIRKTKRVISIPITIAPLLFHILLTLYAFSPYFPGIPE